VAVDIANGDGVEAGGTAAAAWSIAICSQHPSPSWFIPAMLPQRSASFFATGWLAAAGAASCVIAR
jgi:hypothetical protein